MRRMPWLLVLAAALAPAFLPTPATAHSDDHPTQHEARTTIPSQCKYIGVKSVKEFVSRRDVTCLKTLRQAENRGFIDAFSASFKSSELHAYSTELFGANTVPPVATSATATCTGVMNHASSHLTMVCTHTIQNPTFAHIHLGESGEKGPMVCSSPSAISPVAFDCELDGRSHHALHEGGLYINLHSSDFPDGELRNQIQ